MDKLTAFWNRFLESKNLPKDTTYATSFYFGAGEEMAKELLDLVLQGKKRATTSALPSFEAEGEKVPEVGDYIILTEFDGTPRCVAQDVAVLIKPFCEMTFDIVKREGEDECLETWQENHRKFFGMDAEALGYTFNENTLVVFEDFEVVYVEEL